MQVCVIGLGYVGLPTALMLSAHGAEVTGVDSNPQTVAALRRGELPFAERGLNALFERALDAGIVFTTQYPRCGAYIIAVQTPHHPENKRLDPAPIISAVRSVAAVCPGGALMVIESTVPPGTIDRVVRPLLSEGGPNAPRVQLAHAPERILPGNMLYELEHNPRTIGADSREAGERAAALYSLFCSGRMVLTDIRTAEMAKIAENTYRDINIAFANELLRICRADGLDAHEIIRIANMHPRVNILSPGPGVGGHCIPVDPWFLVGEHPDLAPLIRQARQVNDSMPEYVLERMLGMMRRLGIADASRVGVYGLAYKENVDDTRESPALRLLELMRERVAGRARVYDPLVKRDLLPNQFHDAAAFLEGVELVVVMAAHDELRLIEPMLGGRAVLDTRHALRGENVEYL